MEAAWFSPEQGRELWQDYLRRKQLPAQQTQNFPQRRTLDEPSPHRVFVYNTGSEIIPAYGCMRVIGTRNINNVTAIDVEKPTSTDGEFLFNGPYQIAVPSDAEAGVGWAYRFGVVIMLGNGPTEPGVQYLPIVDSWEVEEGSGPFVVYGHHRANELTDDRALVGRFNGGGGGGHEIFFEIESVTCDESGTKTLYVTALWYDGGCTKTIPGADQYGIITVIDPCGELAYYTAEWLGSGSVKGWAKYMYPRGDGYCEPEWLVRSICGVPGCA